MGKALLILVSALAVTPAFSQPTQHCERHAAQEAAANPCDRFAADRHDPFSVSAGVDATCMRYFAERAVTACTAEAVRSPGTLRFRTQLARSLAHSGKFAEAQREARAAADAGSSAAMVLLGVMSQRGLGTPENGKEALAWYRKAADAGDERGAALVAASAHSGIGVEKGSPEAKALMQEMWLQRPANPPRTLAQRAEAGEPRAMHNLAAQLEHEKKYDQAFRWYAGAAEQGFRPSEWNVAQMYEKGWGVARDTQEARRRYRSLAAAGGPEARYHAARLAAEAGDYREAHELYERAAHAGDVRAMIGLGELYEHGRGAARDMARAISFYEKAGERNRWVRFKLGVLHLERQEYAAARRWLERAAADGHEDAKNNLAWLYERGLGGKSDVAAARDLYIAAMSSKPARGNLENLYAAGGHDRRSLRIGAEAGIAEAQYRLGVLDDDLEWLVKAANQRHSEARREAGERLYRLERYAEAAGYRHDAAMRIVARQLAEYLGKPEAADAIYRDMAARPLPPPYEYVGGLAMEPGIDPGLTREVRVAAVGIAQHTAGNESIADINDIIRWK